MAGILLTLLFLPETSTTSPVSASISPDRRDSCSAATPNDITSTARSTTAGEDHVRKRSHSGGRTNSAGTLASTGGSAGWMVLAALMLLMAGMAC
ncbi:hypothetical protein [Prauserella endophytica]|uniref:Uncharacterized protein n=1 Tax=Prauserella endophytica TaxID=1592324 RepID=A0ABY2RVU3_9PSEU|nr:hypothetical protein [Prauserella endophytica]TKG60802.1 hypothetical protein FCN18_34740 [Prauserella endophytica]